jgi:hypothetical protein
MKNNPDKTKNAHKQGAGMVNDHPTGCFRNKELALPAPKMDLVDHVVRLKGLAIPKRKHLCPPRK